MLYEMYNIGRRPSSPPRLAVGGELPWRSFTAPALRAYHSYTNNLRGSDGCGAWRASTSAAPSRTCCSTRPARTARRVRLAKIPTTRRQPGRRRAGGDALEAAGVSPADLDLVIHGTTTTTNAVLERKVATRRAHHHARLPRHPRARPPHAAQALRHDRHLRAADPARAAPRGRRAHERARARCSTPLDEAAGRGGRRSAPCWPGLREPRHPFPACLRQPGARAARRRDRAARSGPTPTSRSATRCCRSSASTSAAPPPPSTPPCSRSSTATCGRLQGELEAQRLQARPAGHERQRRHGGGARWWRARRPRP